MGKRGHRTKRFAMVVVAVAIAFGVAAVVLPGAGAATPDEVEQFLSVLRVAPEDSMSGYDRDEFPHWSDNNGDCQDTRDEVLAWESTVEPTWDSEGCNVVSGRWWSAYDNVELTNPAEDIQIDHMIPLAEAWRSGAQDWSIDTRGSLANDLNHEETLRAVSGSSNSSKSDQDPSEWLPPNSGFHCQYLIEWVRIKDTWDLAVDQAEYDALYDGLLPCDLP